MPTRGGKGNRSSRTERDGALARMSSERWENNLSQWSSEWIESEHARLNICRIMVMAYVFNLDYPNKPAKKGQYFEHDLNERARII
jgi:hypothetical protein